LSPSGLEHRRAALACVGTALLAGWAEGLSAAQPSPPVIRVGPGRALRRIADAARLAVTDAVVEVDAGDYLADVAVWDLGRLTIRAVGGAVRLLASGAHVEGKAIWVVRGGVVTVEGIEFIGARVPDGNGAGIRLESGSLTVRRCRFLDNQNGILTSNAQGTRLWVEHSEFSRNGAGDGRSHGLYAGRIDRLTLRGNHFHGGRVGHLVKSRAQHNRIEYNRLTDEAGGSASYELEFPDGGEAEVVGNIIQQAAGTQNPVLVSLGAEGLHWPVNTLRFAHNTLANDWRGAATFVRVSPGTDRVQLRNNVYLGPGRNLGVGRADVDGERHATVSDFSQAASLDYRLVGRARAWRASPLAASDAALQPHFEYRHPLGIRPLAGPALLPGALQSTAP
jgi:hypothetical protein